MHKRLGNRTAELTDDGWVLLKERPSLEAAEGLIMLLVIILVVGFVVVMHVLDERHMERQHAAIRPCLEKGGHGRVSIDGRRAYFYCDGVKVAP